jgi:hypothetical protein
MLLEACGQISETSSLQLLSPPSWHTSTDCPPGSSPTSASWVLSPLSPKEGQGHTYISYGKDNTEEVMLKSPVCDTSDVQSI